MVLIYTSEITSRLDYITRFLFNDLLGLGIRLTNSIGEFNSHPGPKLLYGTDPVKEALWIRPEGILFEHGISIKSTQITRFRDIPVFFQDTDPGAMIPFDIFGAAFYLISRYEEYLPHSKDRYGRFRVQDSLAFRNGFLELPLVNLWARILGDILTEKYPGLKVKTPDYRYVPTIDVDHAYAYLSRTIGRTAGGIVRSMTRGELFDIYRRIRVLTGFEKDPYDNFEYLLKLHQRYSTPLLYFILFANYGGDDNNVTLHSTRFRRLLGELARDHEIGIHPSVLSGTRKDLLLKEYEALSEVIGRPIVASRQHFLRFSFPDTFRRLIGAGITHDYSMGYANEPGFRAGTSVPFPYFDLLTNEPTNLIIHPITLMDVTLRDHLRLNPDQALQLIQNYIKVVRSAGGSFVSIWHNESLGDTGKWKGWRQVYEKMVETASI